MKIALVQNGQVTQYGNRESFGVFSDPPSRDQLDQYGAFIIQSSKEHDSLTQKLVECDPYFENGLVYSVSVAAKTDEDIAADKVAAMSALKVSRNGRLLACDWTQLLDCKLSSDKIAEWRVYRQALRDLPETIQDARGFNSWPATP